MPVNSFDDYPMSWRPDLSEVTGPKYLALVELLERDIQSGALKAGTKLPPQRELADFLDLSLSTVSRAFKLCEQKGLISASVGSGTFVSSDAAAESIFLCENPRESMIDMGALVPLTSSNQKVKQSMERLLKRPDALNCFSYGISEGSRRQREAGASWLRRSGFPADSANVMLAAGGQNALTAALGALFKSGDKVGTDPLTYSGVKTAARLLGIHLIDVQCRNDEMTEEGIRYAVQNENIRGLYIIPDFHNPTAHVMSLKTRRMIARVAREERLIVIEDGITNLLLEHPIPPAATFAPERIVYLSSLSKTVSAGLRTAFLHVPEEHHSAFVETLYAMNVALSPLLATTSAELIEDGEADAIVAERKRDIAARNQIVDRVLDGFSVAGAPTSPLRYLRLPEHFTGKSFEICAQTAGVQVFGAERFSVGNRPVEKAVRLSVTTPPSEALLEEGVTRLRRLLLQ